MARLLALYTIPDSLLTAHLRVEAFSNIQITDDGSLGLTPVDNHGHRLARLNDPAHLRLVNGLARSIYLAHIRIRKHQGAFPSEKLTFFNPARRLQPIVKKRPDREKAYQQRHRSQEGERQRCQHKDKHAFAAGKDYPAVGARHCPEDQEIGNDRPPDEWEQKAKQGPIIDGNNFPQAESFFDVHMSDVPMDDEKN